MFLGLVLDWIGVFGGGWWFEMVRMAVVVAVERSWRGGVG